MTLTHVGWYKHPRTMLCQTWLSLDGKTIMLVSAHRRVQSARATVKKLEEADEQGILTDPIKRTLFLRRLFEAGEPYLEPFPEEAIKDFGLDQDEGKLPEWARPEETNGLVIYTDAEP